MICEASICHQASTGLHRKYLKAQAAGGENRQQALDLARAILAGKRPLLYG
jgi:hypothetical protein